VREGDQYIDFQAGGTNGRQTDDIQATSWGCAILIIYVMTPAYSAKGAVFQQTTNHCGVRTLNQIHSSPKWASSASI